MINLFYVASGGSLGAVLRYLTSNFYRFYFPNFPFGTLFINFLGSFLIGILASNLENQGTSYAFIKYFLIIGILGSFTITIEEDVLLGIMFSPAARFCLKPSPATSANLFEFE